MVHVTKARIYLDKAPEDPDARVVDEESGQANYLLAGAGVEVSDELAEKFNLGEGAEVESPLDQERRLLAKAEREGLHSEAASRRLNVANMEADERVAADAKANRSRVNVKAVEAPAENKAAVRAGDK